jgi:hypothetical protein
MSLMPTDEDKAFEKGFASGAKTGQTRVEKIVAKLRRVADQCEAGGHKSRARMFRSLAKEFEGKRYE